MAKFLLTDQNVAASVLPKLPELQQLPNCILEPGESVKSARQLLKVWDWLADQGAGKADTLIALGGGTILDLAGFAASTFKRGIQINYFPTTLLAMVDAAHGGKTGINLTAGKNLAGLILQPVPEVHFQIDWLQSLPERELRSGWVELFKHGIVREFGLALWMETCSFKQLPPLDILERGIAIKNDVVSRDPHDHNLRQILNFGHSIGHAVEAASHLTDKPLLHGEAIALGMIAEAYISHHGHRLREPSMSFVVRKLLMEFPDLRPRISFEELKPFLFQDKKNQAESLRMSLMRSLGEADWAVEVSLTLARKSWDFVRSLWPNA